MGWAGFVKVDGTTYNFLGAPSVPSVSFQKSVQESMTVGVLFCVGWADPSCLCVVHVHPKYLRHDLGPHRPDSTVPEPSRGVLHAYTLQTLYSQAYTSVEQHYQPLHFTQTTSASFCQREDDTSTFGISIPAKSRRLAEFTGNSTTRRLWNGSKSVLTATSWLCSAQRERAAA